MELPTVPPPCPKCGETAKVAYTVETLIGSYCRCRACGNVWHFNAQPLKAADPTKNPLRPENG